MLTLEQKTKKIAAAEANVERLRRLTEDRANAVQRGRQEAGRLLAAADIKEAGYVTAQRELEYAVEELELLKKAPVNG